MVPAGQVHAHRAAPLGPLLVEDLRIWRARQESGDHRTGRQNLLEVIQY
jgi:hypothetical protein